MNNPNIVYFDLETQHTAREVGGWRNAHHLRMSIGVTFSTLLNKYTIYWEPTVASLIDQLTKADLVVGFNILRFDYHVLQAYTTFDLRQIPTLDLLVDIERQIKRKISLDSLVKATLGLEKTADGLQAVKWFRENKLDLLAEYCCYDVKLTMLLHQFGMKNGYVFYTDKTGAKQPIKVNWCPRQDSNLYGFTH